MPRQKRYTTQKSQETFPRRLRMLNDEKCAHEKESGIYLTREQIAKEIGKSRQSYAAYLDGSISPDLETLASLARYFNVSTDWLLGLTDVRTLETNVRTICEYTGFSEEALVLLRDGNKSVRDRVRTAVNALLRSEKGVRFLLLLYKYFYSEYTV